MATQESKPENKNDILVMALYPSEEMAQKTIEDLKVWDHVNDEIKLGAIGMISKDGDKVKTHIPRKVGTGAKVGAVAGIVAGVLSGGVTLLVGLAGGTAIGAITGAFFKKSTNLSKAEIEEIGQKLDAGHVAILVMCDDAEVPMVKEYLTAPGVTVSTYNVPADLVAETATAMQNLGELPKD